MFSKGNQQGAEWRVSDGIFDKLISERFSDHTHCTDEETEALRSFVTCPS